LFLKTKKYTVLKKFSIGKNWDEFLHDKRNNKEDAYQ